MYIPMGTIVTVCMFLTVIFGNRFPNGGLQRVTPNWLLHIVGLLAGVAGFWNVLWYGIQHMNEFWGHMALGSGVLMIILSLQLIVPRTRTNNWLNRLNPLFVLALLAFAIHYARTIQSL